MADQLAMEFDDLIDRGVVTLETNDQWLALNLPDSLLLAVATLNHTTML